MVKLILLALSVTVATLAGSYGQRKFAQSTQGHDPAAERSGQPGHASLQETELLAIPVISEGDLQGFFFLRLAYAPDAGLAQTTVSADLLISDSFYMFAANNPAYRLPDLNHVNIDALTSGLKDVVNRHAGAPLIEDVYLTQLDYFASADVRKKSIERRLVLQEPKAKEPATADAHAAPAH